jgi:hypothetical protein
MVIVQSVRRRRKFGNIHTENKEQLLEKWRKLHPGETPAYACPIEAS